MLGNKEKKAVCHICAETPDLDGDDHGLTTDEAELKTASDSEACSSALEIDESSTVSLWRISKFWCGTVLQSLLSQTHTHSCITVFNRLKGSRGLRATHSNTDQC